MLGRVVAAATAVAVYSGGGESDVRLGAYSGTSLAAERDAHSPSPRPAPPPLLSTSLHFSVPILATPQLAPNPSDPPSLPPPTPTPPHVFFR